jgi:hypothetical protein
MLFLTVLLSLPAEYALVYGPCVVTSPAIFERPIPSCTALATDWRTGPLHSTCTFDLQETEFASERRELA